MMMKLTDKSKILIYGYGVEGQSTHAFFEGLGITPHIYDEFKEDYNTPPNLDDFDMIVVSAGIRPDTKIPAQHLDKCTSNVALFFHNLSTNNKAKIIGITGTKGKSMTTKLTHETLEKAGKKSAIAGNFGKGLLDLVHEIDDLDYLVIELSSYQLASLDVSPPYALCTNLYEDHLDWHGDVEHYHHSKAHLWQHQDENGKLFVPEHQADHPMFNLKTEELKNLGTTISCKPVSPDLFPENAIWRAQHYCENFGLVKALMDDLDQSSSSQVPKFSSSFQAACKELKGLPHRLDYRGTFNEILFYDDAISTNPKSTIAAIKFFDQKLDTLIVGGQDRNQDFVSLFKAIYELRPTLHVIVLPCEARDRIHAPLHAAEHLEHSLASSMKEAVEIAFKKTSKDRICLLSPAAPSFDHYKNYIEKGKDFEKCIQNYVTSPT